MTQTPKRKLKAGDPVMLPSGLVTELTDIQYEHNRYQLYAVSNWQYGIENLQPADWKAEALKWREEALRKYPTPEAYEAACAALEKHRARADAAEEEARYQKGVTEDYAKGYRLQELRAIAAEAREQRLKEELEGALRFIGRTEHIPEETVAGFIRAHFSQALSTLYPDTPAPTSKEEEESEIISRKPFFTGYKPQFIGPRKETSAEKSLRLDIERWEKDHARATKNPKGAPAPKEGSHETSEIKRRD